MRFSSSRTPASSFEMGAMRAIDEVDACHGSILHQESIFRAMLWHPVPDSREPGMALLNPLRP